jgi:hypothetical protein
MFSVDMANMKRSIVWIRGKLVTHSLLISVFLLFSAYGTEAGKGSINIAVMPPTELAVTVEFKDTSGDTFLEAGEKGALIITVINNGKTVSRKVSAQIRSDKGDSRLDFPKSVNFGSVTAGKTVKREAGLRAKKDISPGSVGLDISVSDAHGFESEIISVDIGLKAAKNPKLVIHDFGINDKSKNLQIEPRERVVLVVRIKNTGGGVARDVNVEIDYGKDVTICGAGITSFDIGELRPGQYEDVKFNFYGDKGIKRGERIPIDVKITEERPEFSATIPVDIEMYSPQNSYDTLNE